MWPCHIAPLLLCWSQMCPCFLPSEYCCSEEVFSICASTASVQVTVLAGRNWTSCHTLRGYPICLVEKLLGLSCLSEGLQDRHAPEWHVWCVWIFFFLKWVGICSQMLTDLAETWTKTFHVSELRSPLLLDFVSKINIAIRQKLHATYASVSSELINLNLWFLCFFFLSTRYETVCFRLNGTFPWHETIIFFQIFILLRKTEEICKFN